MNLSWTYRNVRRLLVTIIGATVILFGVALLVLPGPGTVVIVVGLAILASEWVWAARLLKRLKSQGKDVADGLWQALGFRRRETSPETGGGGDATAAGSAPAAGEGASGGGEARSAGRKTPAAGGETPSPGDEGPRRP